MSRPADVFDDIQAHIEASMFIRDNSLNRQDIRDFTFSDVDLRGCKNVLDLGCAYGFFTRGLAGRLHPDAVVEGVDLWPGCEEPYIEACRESGFSGRFRLADKPICKEYPDESFDLVLCSYTLYFFPEAIPEIARVLRPAGFLIAVTHIVPHMQELVAIVRKLISERLGRPVLTLPLEKLFNAFSGANGLQMLSPLFAEIQEKRYENGLLINAFSLPGLIRYLCFKRPLFFSANSMFDNRFITSVIADYLLRLLIRQESLTISKSDMVYICHMPLKNRGGAR